MRFSMSLYVFPAGAAPWLEENNTFRNRIISVGGKHSCVTFNKKNVPKTQLFPEDCSDFVFGFAYETLQKTQASQMYYKSRTAHVIFLCFFPTILDHLVGIRTSLVTDNFWRALLEIIRDKLLGHLMEIWTRLVTDNF